MINRHVCRKHFDITSYINKKLSKTAIPTLNLPEPINIDFVKAIFCKSIDGDFVGNKAEITIQKVVDDYELEICKYSYFCSTFTVSSTEFK